MIAQIDVGRWRTNLLALLDETFERVEGIYLDKGTSLFETLATVTADEASRPISRHCASIAAQVNHVRYYLEVLGGYLRRQPPASVDWPASWDVPAVSADQWDDLRQSLHETYQQLRTFLESYDTWDGEEDMSDALAIVVHTAYHLGEIRQGLGVLRG